MHNTSHLIRYLGRYIWRQFLVMNENRKHTRILPVFVPDSSYEVMLTIYRVLPGVTHYTQRELH